MVAYLPNEISGPVPNDADRMFWHYCQQHELRFSGVRRASGSDIRPRLYVHSVSPLTLNGCRHLRPAWSSVSPLFITRHIPR